MLIVSHPLDLFFFVFFWSDIQYLAELALPVVDFARKGANSSDFTTTNNNVAAKFPLIVLL